MDLPQHSWWTCITRPGLVPRLDSKLCLVLSCLVTPLPSAVAVATFSIYILYLVLFGSSPVSMVVVVLLRTDGAKNEP